MSSKQLNFARILKIPIDRHRKVSSEAVDIPSRESIPTLGVCVIDLREMHGVLVDPIEQTAWVQVGALPSISIEKAFVYGLVIPNGQVTQIVFSLYIITTK